MSDKITFDYSKAASFIKDDEVSIMKKLVGAAKEELLSKTGAGNDFLGWIDLPVDYDKEEFSRIKAAADKIKSVQRCFGNWYWRILIWGPEQLLNF